jgi:hypothetical protein
MQAPEKLTALQWLGTKMRFQQTPQQGARLAELIGSELVTPGEGQQGRTTDPLA